MNIETGEIRTRVIEDHILIIECDRQAKRNALTPEMAQGLIDAYTRLDETDDLWCGVLTFAGAHTTGGLDLPKFGAVMETGKGLRPDNGVDPYSLGRRCRKPVVAALKGITFTWGIEIALGADIVIAAEDCRFSQLEPKRAIMAFGGATIRFVQRAGWGNAMYHLLRAGEFDAQEAYRIGLAQEIVPAAQVDGRAIAIAREICANAPLAVQATKMNAAATVAAAEAAAIAQFEEVLPRLAATEDAREGVASFVERRAAKYTGR